MFLNIRTLAIALTASVASLSLEAALLNGPMLSHVDMREASVWVQADTPSLVRVTYKEEGGSQSVWSSPVETSNQLGNTATVKLDKVEPGKRYSYQVELNGELIKDTAQFNTPTFFQGRTPAPDLRIAIGGSNYVTEEGYEPPYQILGGGYGIFSTIHDSKPDLMLWLGNTAHLRDSDWSTQSGILKRFTKARAVPELAPLLSSIPHYATWGKRDYSLVSSGSDYTYRELSEAGFRAFWPQPATVPALKGLATRFSKSDVDFFMLDVRSYRNDTPDSSQNKQILGEDQIDWLRQELIRSTATFKIIVAGCPILNPADSPDNFSFADSEQTAFLQMLRDENIPGLFFLSGGKPFGELTRLVHASSYNLYDLTVGPLTSKPEENSNELNFFRMPGSSTFERQFALIDVTGPEEDRMLSLRVMSMEGKELWKRDIKASQLQSLEE